MKHQACIAEKLSGESLEKHSITVVMSSSRRTRPEAEEEAGRSSPWKKYRLDVDTLECPICTEPFSPPVFQCDNGHTACSKCCEKLNTAKKCPSCGLTIGRIRCLAIEKVIESLWVACEIGCGTELRFHERDEHERSLCEYRPIKCPQRGCEHMGPRCEISDHLLTKHDIPTLEDEWVICERSRSTSFDMGNNEEPVVLVKAKEAWLLVNLVPCRKGHKFTVEPVWVSKEDLVFKLTVMAYPHTHRRAYSMERALFCTERVPLSRTEIAISQGDLQQYLFVPGVVNLMFDVILSLIA